MHCWREPIRESFLNDFYRSASPSRAARPNFIGSPYDFKQLGRFLSLPNDRNFTNGLIRRPSSGLTSPQEHTIGSPFHRSLQMTGVGAPTEPQLLDTQFPAHLEGICLRTARALEACGFTALLVHSGSLLPVFQDDHTYAYKAHAPFKVWAPLLDAPDCFLYFQPGRRPLLAFHQPQDYWYKPPSLPSGYWTRHFDIRPCRDLDEARRLLPHDLARTAYLGDSLQEIASWRLAAINPPHLIRHLDYPRAAKSLTSSAACGRRAASAPEVNWLRHAPLRAAPRSSRSSLPSSPPAACASRSSRTTRSSPSTRTVRSCTTRCWNGPDPLSIARS